jgi:beta-glucosidase
VKREARSHVVRSLALASIVALPIVSALAAIQGEAPAGPQRPLDQRVEELLQRLTLDEKISLVHGDSLFTTAGVPRLGLPPRSLSDGPHGVREELGPRFRPLERGDDFATWLPVGVALASTWNPPLAEAYGRTLGQESLARGKSILLGPGVNIARTPLCGRNFEYFGEDPYLAARMVVPWIKGIQGQGVAACVKHFALNNQEVQRNTIDVLVDERPLREIYLPAFEAAVKEGGVLTVMGGYNKFRGQHACHNEYLLNTVLKREWGFQGLVMSDWNGTHDTREAALHGLDLEMGTARPFESYFLAAPFKELIEKGELPLALLDDKVRRNLRVLLATQGLEGRPAGALNAKAHQETARKVAEEAIVLLKNEGGLLPLDPARVKTIAVIGENATRKQAAGGGSSGIKALYEVTPLEGILRRAGAANVIHAAGYRARKAEGTADAAEAAALLVEQAVAAARQADVAIVVGGLNHDRGFDAEGADRANLELPGGQAALVSRVLEANPRTVVVLVSGGPVEMEPWLARTPAVVQAWYGGMEGGNALAAALFGDVNPSGKLPVTFPRALADSPAHALGNYPGKDGTVRYEEGLLVGYRWFDARAIEPLFPFGHGLSYTTFEYSALRVRGPLATAGEESGALAVVEVDVANTGSRAGSEVVQIYVGDSRSSLPRPPKELKGFRKVALAPGEKRTVTIALGPEAFAFYEPGKQVWLAEAGEFGVQAGSSSRDIRARGSFRLAKTRTVTR